MIVIHASLLAAVQLHSAPAVTATVSVVPVKTTLVETGEIVDTQGAPACVTVKVLPPIVRVPVREVVTVFDAMSNVTEPAPLPLAPDATVIHVAVSAAVHAHPVAADTVTVFVLAPNATFAEAGEIVGAHGAPACVTLNALPPTVRLAVRAVVVAFAVKL